MFSSYERCKLIDKNDGRRFGEKMAIYTPRGLAIRLNVDYAFALMARLYPETDAFRVLKTVEGLESIPSMLAFITGLVCFYLKIDPYQIGLYTLIVSVVGQLLLLLGLFPKLLFLGLIPVPGLPKLGTWYSYISGFGILLIFLAVYGFLSVGWQGVVAFFIGKFIAIIIFYGIESWNEKRIFSKIGMPLTGTEINFLNAYRLHAAKLKKPLEIEVSDEELNKENWKECFLDLAQKWPEVVNRFTSD